MLYEVITGAYDYSTGQMTSGDGFGEKSKVYRFDEWTETPWFKFKVICKGCSVITSYSIHYTKLYEKVENCRITS